MKFAKDILVVDFEGLRSPKQIGAVLLDKETLDEKDSFVSYIYAEVGDRVGTKSGINQNILNGAPSQAEVGKMIFAKFGTEVILSAFVADLDIRHFRTLMQAADIDPTLYDYHIFDIWPIAYAYLITKGYDGGIRSEEIFQAFEAKPRNLHDALEDARLAASALRKVVLK